MRRPASELDRLKGVLLRGIKASKQTSYERGAPSRKSRPDLLEARLELGRYLTTHPGEAEAWRLLSLAHECCLDYSSARRSLQRAISLCPIPDRRDLKRLGLLKEGEKKR